jgi:carboxypeptidase family protein
MKLAAAAVVLALATSAPEPATIRGDVRDREWKPIADARVVLEPAAAGSVRTSGDGSFVFSGIPPGHYEVVVIKEGFLPWAELDVELGAAGTVVLHAVMDQGYTGSITFDDEATAEQLASYDADLAAFEELPLCSPERARPGFEGYRFLWLRSFHHPVVIDLRFKPQGELEVVYKETDGAGGYGLGKLTRTNNRRVDKNSFDADVNPELAEGVVRMIREESFAPLWNLPYSIQTKSIGLDGATWTIEGVKNSRCHVVTRWSPPEQDAVRTMGLQLMDLADQRIDPAEIY